MAVESRWSALASALGPGIRHQVALAPYTSMRVGGPADLLIVVESAEELARAVILARQQRVPWRVLGGGCNVLISDRGLRGLVIINRAASVSLQDRVVEAESGAKLATVAERAVNGGLVGLAWAAGLPGTVGGAIVGNAGAYGGDVAGVLRTALVLEPDGEVRERPSTWFQFRYRESRLKGVDGTGRERAQTRCRGSGALELADWVILKATLGLEVGDALSLRAKADEIIERRRAAHPHGATMGSTFKNPAGDHAGRLIEQAGLKGHRVGGAQISEQHGNFFINVGGARAEDVRNLIQHAQAEVARRLGVRLELEIELLGWQDTE